MDVVRFGEDHSEFFDSETYLRSYLKEDHCNEYTEFSLRCFQEFWSEIGNTNLRVLEFGGGPTICNLITAAPYVKEIIFAEYTEKNRREVQKWLEKSPDAHDWSLHFKFVVENLEGRNREDVKIRECELREKISHILACDINWQDPVQWPSSCEVHSFDVVTTSLCLEACVTSSEGYRHAIAKLKTFLKPGGFIALYGVLGETFYMVGQEKFYCFPLSKELVEETLINEGFKTRGEMKIRSWGRNANCDANGFFFLSAVLLP